MRDVKVYSLFDPPPAFDQEPGEEPSATKQEFAKDADLNTIMGRYSRGGSLPSGTRVAQYGDFVGLDYRTIRETMAQGSQEFEALPADLRRKFDNDPAAYFSFIASADKDQLQELGLDALVELRFPDESVPAAPAAAPAASAAPVAPSPTPSAVKAV